MKKLIILQTITPDYRRRLFEFLEKKLGTNFILYGGDTFFQSSIKSDHCIKKEKINNFFFFNKKILFQTGIWHLLLLNDIIVLELNPRIISNWIFLIIRMLFRKKTVLWGHAWPREGKGGKSDTVRNLMRHLADEIIVYTKTQEIELKERMPDKKIRSAANALYFASEIKKNTNFNSKIKNNIIYVGRLTEEKKPLFLVRSFLNAIKYLPEETKLFLIGEGEEKSKIIDFLKKKNATEKVLVKGHISKYEDLLLYYNKSLVSISPGYVGLSIIQSFSFGVPMLISSDENHAPEIEAAIPNLNAIFFRSDDDYDFKQMLIKIYDEKEIWSKNSEKIISFVLKNYTIETMAQPFINLLK